MRFCGYACDCVGVKAKTSFREIHQSVHFLHLFMFQIHLMYVCGRHVNIQEITFLWTNLWEIFCIMLRLYSRKRVFGCHFVKVLYERWLHTTSILQICAMFFELCAAILYFDNQYFLVMYYDTTKVFSFYCHLNIMLIFIFLINFLWPLLFYNFLLWSFNLRPKKING